METKKIILCGGGTAGHIMPCIALIPELKKYFDEIIYLGSTSGMEYDIVKEENIPFYHVNSIKFDRTKLFANLKIPFLLPKYIKQCEKLLKELKPSIVFSKGGYVSLPVTIACKNLSIPYVLHESDATLGLANKLATKNAKLILTNFNGTHKRETVVGVPLRDSLFCNIDKSNILKELNLPIRKTILIMGGSLGAKSINSVIYNLLEWLVKRYNVIHITGKNNPSNVKLGGYMPITFTSDIGKLLKASDIVISRAGATAINELRALNKKSILIPLSKKASRGDQIINAQKVCKENKLFKVILDEELNENILKNEIINLDNITQDITVKFNSPTPKIAELIYNASKNNS